MSTPVKIRFATDLVAAITQADADARYVNVPGDTMTGPLIIVQRDHAFRLDSGVAGADVEMWLYNNGVGKWALYNKGNDDSFNIYNLNLNRAEVVILPSGGIYLTRLAGTGSRAVVADASGGLSAARPSEGDLVFASNFGPTGAMSAIGCFTAEYRDYEVWLHVDTATAGAVLSFRLMSGATPNTAAAYSMWGAYGSSVATSVTGFNASLTTAWAPYGLVNDTMSLEMVMQILNPFAAWRTTGQMWAADMRYGAATLTALWAMFAHTSNVSFDGLYIYPSAGLITGHVKVYGKRESV